MFAMKTIRTFVLLCFACLFCSCMKQRRLTPQLRLPAAESTVPIVLIEEFVNIVLVHASVNGEKGLFVIDTGANVCILSQQFSRKLGRELQPLPGWRTKSNVTSKMHTVQVDAFSLGTSVFENFKAVVLDLEHINQLGGTPVDGIIGMNLLRQIGFTIDYDQRRLTLCPEKRHGVVAPVILKDDELFIDMLVEGKPIRMKIDTGSSYTEVDDKIWRFIAGDRPVTNVTFSHADINKNKEKRVKQLTLSGVVMGDLISSIDIRKGKENLLGMNFLKTGAVTFPAGENLMFFEKANEAAASDTE